MSKNVAIIGAGPAGLAAAKAADEAGLTPVVFERESTIGGVWSSTGAAWNGLITNVSRYTCAFSDHPWDDAVGDFPTRNEMLHYLHSYVDDFGIDRRIRFDSEVTALEPFNGHWNLTCRNKLTGKEDKTCFDAAIVASGFFSRKVIPELVPGVEPFRGAILHAREYRDPEGFRGKRVLVAGAAFSGVEIAAELAEARVDVTVAMPKPMWILPRYVSNGCGKSAIPLDLVFYTRSSSSPTTPELTEHEKHRVANRYFDALGGNPGGIDPSLRIDPESTQVPYVVISDSFVRLARAGAIRIVRERVSSLAGNRATMSGGHAIPADAVIWCTGYTPALSYFPDEVLGRLKFVGSDTLQPLLLHQCTFPVGLENLAFSGLYRGPYFGIMELQARWACAVFSGDCRPPSPAEIERGIDEELRIRNMVPRPQFPHGDYVTLADSIARELGVMPDLNPKNDHYNTLWNGPLIPAHYRLRGAFSKPELAREQIQKVMSRIQNPLRPG
jgi:dimethylaniline monooxygenase (N-oxide forming)